MPDIQNALMIQIAADTARLRQGLTEAEGLLGGFSSRAERVGQTLSSWGGSLQQAFAPLAGFSFDSLTSFAGFDAVLTDIQLYGGVAAGQMGAIEAAAVSMSRQTMYSAQQSAQAILEFAKTGYDAQQAMRMAEAAARLATVGDMDMAAAAGVLTSSMAQFNLTAADTDQIIEALARAAGASRADVNTLAQGMANVGPVARAFGLDFEDTAAILSVFSDAGIQGADAGTQLRSMLMNLYQPTATTQAALRSLNLSLYDTEGNARPLASVFDDLIDRMNSGEYSTQTLNEAFQRLFGAYGIVGAQSLLAAGGWDEMRAAMDSATSAADIYAGKQETLQFRMGQLNTAWDTVKTTFGEALADTLSPMIGDLTVSLTRLSDWIAANPGVAGTLGALAIAGVTLGGALMIAGPMVTAFAKGLGLLTAVIGFIKGTGILTGLAALAPSLLPLGLALAPIAGGLAIILGVIRSDWDNIGVDKMRQGFEDIGFGIAALVAGDSETGLASIGEGLKGIAEGAAQVALAPLDGVIKILNDLGLTDLTGLSDFVEMFRGIFSNLAIIIGQAWEDVSAAMTRFRLNLQIAAADLMKSIEDSSFLKEVLRFAAPQLVAVMDEVKTTTGQGIGEWIRDDLVDQVQRMDLIAAAETALNAEIASGEVTLGNFTFTDTFGNQVTTTIQTVLETALTDPAFSEALDSSLYMTIQNALTLAEGEDYNFLFDAAAALVIYGEVRPEIIAFMQNAMAQPVTVDVPVFINPVLVGIGATPTPGLVGQAFNPGVQAQPRPAGFIGPMLPVGYQAPPPPAQQPGLMTIQQFATGGLIQQDGLGYIHSGERILPAKATRDYDRGGGQPIQVTVNSYGSSPYELAILVERALRDKGI